VRDWIACLRTSGREHGILFVVRLAGNVAVVSGGSSSSLGLGFLLLSAFASEPAKPDDQCEEDYSANGCADADACFCTGRETRATAYTSAGQAESEDLVDNDRDCCCGALSGDGCCDSRANRC
jgi:hypothetical protein